MELALYHPDRGFYRTRDRFGVRGDFYTAEQLQPVFGKILSSYVEKLTKESKPFEKFDGVLELGAGRAEMAEALSRWGYHAFDWACPNLPERWTGLVFANEFFDALPVHLLKRTRSGWKELLVQNSGNGIGFSAEGVVDQRLLSYAARFGASIPEGGCLEACPAVEHWCIEIASLLQVGKLLVVDYGYEPRELPRFPLGTAMTFRNHRADADLLATPGDRDITAHVNFSWLRECAEAAGLIYESSSLLSNWVLSVWDEQELQQRWERADQRWRLQWKHLVFGLGEVFRVLEFRTHGSGR
jgi:SAM-dependent MidA family methyltransferase